MEDTNKALARLLRRFDSDSAPADHLDVETGGDLSPSETESTKEKAFDRWFHEQRGNKRVPKRLDIPNEVQVASGGPLKVSGNITLIHEDGSITHANHLSLCRCGASRQKPMCDDKHLDIEFFDNGSVTRMSDWMSVQRPQTVTIKAIKDGPLRFRGYLRVFNNKGQECITTRGDLCRCGQSSKKPFCDCM